VFNILLAAKVIQEDNIIVAYVISISEFFVLILAAGDPWLKACLLTAAYFICVTAFLSILAFLVKTQAEWLAGQNVEEPVHRREYASIQASAPARYVDAQLA
jgi:hypothetical protein